MAKNENGNEIGTGEETRKYLDRIFAWTDSMLEYPGFQEWQRERLKRTLFFDEFDHDDDFVDFQADPSTTKSQDFCIAYLELISSAQAIRDCEYYFRRYPFDDLPITHHDHISYICDMFFSRIYQFREKLKRCLNIAKQVTSLKFDAGKVIKAFDRTFDAELRERNSVHHHTRYDDIEIQKLSLANMMAFARDDKPWKWYRQRTYRQISRDWVKRVQSRARLIYQFLEEVSRALDTCSDFLPEKRRKAT